MPVRTGKPVPLHNFEGKYRRNISRSEALDLFTRQKADWLCRKCGRTSDRGRCLGASDHQFVLGMKEPERRDGNSPCAISAREMDAVVGITPGDLGMPPNQRMVKEARDKLALWPFVGDTRAVRVGVRA